MNKILVSLSFGGLLVVFSVLGCSKSDAIPVTSIGLSLTNVDLVVGKTAGLSAVINPSNATETSLNWSSSNDKVVAVSPGVNGEAIINAHAEGSALVKVTSGNGKVISYTSVNVSSSGNSVSLESISLNPSETKVSVDGTAPLAVAFVPDSAPNKKISWVSTNLSVVSVDEKGIVTGIGLGTATVIGSSVDGGKSSKCIVTVIKTKIPVVSFEVSAPSSSLFVSETITLIPVFGPENASNKTVEWASGNPDIATVDRKGVVRGISSGRVKITGITADGGKKGEYYIDVKSK